MINYKIYKDKGALIVDFKNLDLDLSLLNNNLDGEDCSIIFDLSGFSNVSVKKLKNFTNFGNIAARNNSFVIVCKTGFFEHLPIVPTIQEAFDLIELEEIERKLLDK